MVITVIGLIIAAALVYTFRKQFASVLPGVTAKGSAFVRVAEHEALLLEAKGKVIALQAAEKVADEALNELASATSAIHSGRDRIASRIAAINSAL
jgi:hypothetical protein